MKKFDRHSIHHNQSVFTAETELHDDERIVLRVLRFHTMPPSESGEQAFKLKNDPETPWYKSSSVRPGLELIGLELDRIWFEVTTEGRPWPTLPSKKDSTSPVRSAVRALVAGRFARRVAKSRYIALR